VNDDDKYRYNPPWANAEIREIEHLDVWFGLDADCLSKKLVEFRAEDEAASGD
jgi:hypothetical protein